MKQATVCFLLRNDEILLAMKKRGFGVGKWNGAGGKLKDSETPEQAMIREAEEEIGVKIDPANLEKIAEHEFIFPDQNGWDLFVRVYFVKKWQGEPTESEEMRPAWFKLDTIPYDQMWVDDKIWLARALKGEKLKGRFVFAENGERLSEHDLRRVKGF